MTSAKKRFLLLSIRMMPPVAFRDDFSPRTYPVSCQDRRGSTEALHVLQWWETSRGQRFKKPSPGEQSEPIHSNHCFKRRGAKSPKGQSMSETSLRACRVARGLIVGI